MSVIGSNPPPTIQIAELEAKVKGLETLIQEAEIKEFKKRVSEIQEIQEEVEKLKQELPEFKQKITVQNKTFLEKKLRELEADIVKVLAVRLPDKKDSLPGWKRSFYDFLRNSSYVLAGASTVPILISFLEGGNFTQEGLRNLGISLILGLLGFLQTLQKNNRKIKEENNKS